MTDCLVTHESAYLVLPVVDSLINDGTGDCNQEFVAGLKEDYPIREKVDCCTIQQMWLLSYYEKLIRYVVRR